MSIEILTRTILEKMDRIGKWQGDFFVNLVLVWLQLRGRYNFENLGRQGCLSALSYRVWFSHTFDFAAFNRLLIEQYTSQERVMVFDPSFIAKSGKHTYGMGYLRTRCRHRLRSGSGCAQTMKKGLEIADLAAIDVVNYNAFHYRATQTILQPTESLLAYYGNLIRGQATQLVALSRFVVVDAYFSKYNFIETVTASGLQVITRLRDAAALFYPYIGPKREGRGAPRKYAGTVKVKQLDGQYFRPCLQEEDFTAFQALLYSKALKRLLNVVLVHHYKEDGSIKNCKIFASTDTSLAGTDLWLYYHLRFQIEFLYRDAKQFLGLSHCQSRNESRLNFGFNFSLTVISLIKIVHWLAEPIEQRGAFSVQEIKTQYSNQGLLKRFFVAFGLCPQTAKKKPAYEKLLHYAKIAA